MSRTILLVDDEARLRQAVQAYLQGEGFRVVTAGDGQEALYVARYEKPDLIILDLMMPVLDGYGFMHSYSKEADTPIILLTAKVAEGDKVLGLELGADDYITKPFSPRELTARVRALLRRARPDEIPQADVLERAGGRLVVDSVRRRVTLDGELVELTESEFRLLQSLARFPGRVYTRSELVERLQGMEFEPYERTIDAHIKNLRRKLGDDARAPRLVLTVYGRGYAFAEDQR
jgi:two-component system response regulator RegX3